MFSLSSCALVAVGAVEALRGAYAFAARLPEGTDRNTLRARVADGIVIVTAAKAEKPAPRAVPVRGDRHADFAAVEGDAEAAEKETAPAKSILEKGDAENIAEE